jgi:hypothetical protein
MPEMTPEESQSSSDVPDLNVGQLPLDELVQACHVQTQNFFAGEAVCDAFALELLRRAVSGHESAAWAALTQLYGGYVLASIRRHPAHRVTTDDDLHQVHRTFQRFWMGVGRQPVGTFSCTGAILKYLKMCVHSVLVDEVRFRGTAHLVSLAQISEGAAQAEDVAHRVLETIQAAQLWQAVLDELNNERERLTVGLSLLDGLKPASIYERYRESYSDIGDVYRIKRNVLDRLRHSPRIKQYLNQEY